MAEYLSLSGGVGGDRLCDGFYQSAGPRSLSIVVHTDDDFDHCGLSISPDLDTLLYTRSGQSDQVLGWGLREESWRTIERLDELNGQTWFRLGDRDLSTHLRRTELLRRGATLE